MLIQGDCKDGDLVRKWCGADKRACFLIPWRWRRGGGVVAAEPVLFAFLFSR